ncbi:MAG: UTP--glucose-1-phosphate uridylyltransferase [Candidatus Xenobiia bacterium LiM19]
MNPANEKFSPFYEKMKEERIPDIAIRTFEHYYHRLLEGSDGFIREKDIVPVDSLPDLESLPARLAEAGQRAVHKTVIIKLNGGLGTSMGLNGPKSLLKVKNDLTFLDIIARQALHEHIPLLMMNSFATREDTLAALAPYPELAKNFPLDFVQHKVPKVTVSDLSPALWPDNPAHEWCPPGHGDIYTSLLTSGVLDLLLEKGYLYAFVSNSDNLGAVMNRIILGYFSENRIPFLMEVAARTEEDKKGGHLAMYPNGRLLLRESAQCAPADLSSFQDITRHRYFNTNSLWINLHELKTLLESRENVLELPLIRNTKTIDPRDLTSTPVYQLETAMGAAISLFYASRALRVPRTRFLPVKTTNDLFAVYSDAYVLSSDFRVVLNPNKESGGPPMSINLDPRYYKHIDQLEARFPYGPPSLIECERVTIKGDIEFGRNVEFKYAVELINDTDRQIEIADDSVIEGCCLLQ